MSTDFLKLCAILIFNIIQVSFVQTRYIIFNNEVTFIAGFISCKQFNMNPAEVHSDQEQIELEAVIPSIAAGWENGYWLFATILGDFRNYHWLNSGQSVSFAKWNDFEPNNVNGTEKCMEILNVGGTRNFKWNDISCDSRIKFICQLEDQVNGPTQN